MSFSSSQSVRFGPGEAATEAKGIDAMQTGGARFYKDEDLLPCLHAPQRKRLASLYAYWCSRCCGDRPPSRADIDPVDIPALLPILCLADVLTGPQLEFRYRLIGTRLVEYLGELTGRYLSEVIPRTDYPHVWQHYEMAYQGMLVLRSDTLAWQGRKHMIYEVLLLPLRGPTGSIEMILGGATLVKRDVSVNQ